MISVRAWVSMLAVGVLCGCALGGPQRVARPALSTSFLAGESVVEIPAYIGGKTYTLEALLYRPANMASAPLVVMTHDRDGEKPSRRDSEVLGQRAFARALVQRNYAVLYLVRRGYGRSDGPDAEYLPTPEAAAVAGAQDVVAAVAYAHTLSGVDARHIILAGHSQGGWVALAASTLPMDGVIGVINYSGGANFAGLPPRTDVRSHIVEDALERSAAVFGATSRYPVLWVYGDNDTHTVASVTHWFDRFRAAGGRGRLEILPGTGHNTPNAFGGVTALERFVAELH